MLRIRASVRASSFSRSRRSRAADFASAPRAARRTAPFCVAVERPLTAFAVEVAAVPRLVIFDWAVSTSRARVRAWRAESLSAVARLVPWPRRSTDRFHWAMPVSSQSRVVRLVRAASRAASAAAWTATGMRATFMPRISSSLSALARSACLSAMTWQPTHRCPTATYASSSSGPPWSQSSCRVPHCEQTDRVYAW
uniref:Uncharacterized protein n=1 Tax=Streptomyces sp. W75 TaxID=1170711 RepID=I0CEI4_9ACTN|nr:hypothetical protein pCQ4.72c [Streptomyces sp. W75]